MMPYATGDGKGHPRAQDPVIARGGGSLYTLLFLRKQSTIRFSETKGRVMKNPLDSIIGTIVSGFVLTGILFYIVRLIA
jgi:hypothetical protein